MQLESVAGDDFNLSRLSAVYTSDDYDNFPGILQVQQSLVAA
jgi:hypothetical protein